MFLPYSTDAPIYHWPVATVALIVVNVLAFIGTLAATDAGTDKEFVGAAADEEFVGAATDKKSVDAATNEEFIKSLCLAYGNGLHPVQWVTANFLHADVMHLLGNMFGLWAFGLIVEGKIGWWRFLAAYFGIGIVGSAVEQIAFLGADAGFALGASGIVYGLLGMAVIWAPENEVQCVMFLWVRPIFFDMTLWAVAVLWIGIQLLILLFFSGLHVSSEAVHLLGAVIGIAVAVVMVRKNWVDCENWDLFSVWKGRHTMSRDQLEMERAKEREKQQSPEELARQRAEALAQVQAVLAQGNIDLALTAHRKMAAKFEGWALPEADLSKLIAGCSRKGRHADVVLLAVEYLGRYTERASLVRLKLAETLVRHEDRPAQARRVLAKIPEGGLGPKEAALRRQLDQEACARIASGVIEQATEDW